MGQGALSTKLHFGTRGSFVDSGAIVVFRLVTLSFIDRLYGNSHPHFQEFKDNTNNNKLVCAEVGIAILQAIHTEIDGGWLFTLKGLILGAMMS